MSTMTSTFEDAYAKGKKAGEKEYRIYITSVLKYLQETMADASEPEPKLPISSLIALVEDYK